MNSTAVRGFHKLCLYTLIAVYFLIGVGSVVRTTGSGMGCPDWPRCFGQWVPPTSVEELPSDYKQTYSQYRDKKNKKFAKYLTLMGFSDTAEKILTDPAVLQETNFNPVKTWIEYANRLVGVTIGFFIIALFYASFKIKNHYPRLFWISLALLVLVIFQGWFGSIVVSTNLTTWTITVHMFLALLMVALLVYLYHSSESPGVYQGEKRIVKILLLTAITIQLVQVFFGTKVREGIDMAVAAILPRTEWISSAGFDFIRHRTFSWIVVAINLALLWKLGKIGLSNPLIRAIILLILATLLTGVGMAYFAVPAALQPIHLLIATLTFGLQFLLYLRLQVKNTVES